jgi:hypothetical protein
MGSRSDDGAALRIRGRREADRIRVDGRLRGHDGCVSLEGSVG